MVHAVCALINEGLGANGNTVHYLSMKDSLAPDMDALIKVSGKLKAKKVKSLLLLDMNPLYDAPIDFGFEETLKNVGHTVHFGSHVDETARACEWHIPSAHFLESWGDVRSIDGVSSVVQPMIEPLFGGIPLAQMVQAVTTGENKTAFEVVQTSWKKKLVAGNFEKQWRKVLNAGVFKKDLNDVLKVRVNAGRLTDYLKQHPFTYINTDKNSIEIVFQASASVFDGRYANNGWLQEMPHPVSKLTWDNPLFLSPNTAKELNLVNGDMIELAVNGSRLRLPVWILPGHADYSATITLGYGRTAAGRVGNRVGFNTYRLRTSTGMNFSFGGKIYPLNETYLLANTQDHGSMEGRPIVREANWMNLKSIRILPKKWWNIFP